ncbi:MAG: hypothetical protein HY296_06740 [Thaumarchaeota archaeon]|nr:hypothetical protein [Nitrososphaerota archaeon]
MDPLILLDQAVAQEKIPRKIATKVRTRLKYVVGGVRRTEKASGLPYPPFYVEPILPVSKGTVEYGQMGVLFARVVPITAGGTLSIFVQFSAALVAYGTKGTIEAVAAHEFTHYVDLVRRMTTKNLTSDEKETTLFGSALADPGRTVPPKLLFSDRALVALISRKFKDTLVDPALSKKVEQEWVGKGLPIRWVPPEENVVRLGMNDVSSARFDPALVRKVAQIEEKMS